MRMQQNMPIYKLVIVGAGGGIGRQCVEQALQAGHLVTAILRNPAKLAIEHPNLKKVSGDVMQPGAFENNFANQDAVISAIGVAGGFGSDKPTTLYSQGNANVLKAMEQKGIKRMFLISASAIEISPVLPFYIRFIEKYVVQKLLKHMYTDLLKMEAVIKSSNISWTIIRPPQLTNQAVAGTYRIAINAFLKNCLKISRADVAHFIINNIANRDTYQATIEIGY
ncbi:NAD(P)H-binding protein [Mucilaginibacter rubeus]|uniref:NAD(P)H-binding protein n=1 Tax=Mucilaginibacter rubeus TaxID=2027860 RepID=A0AAE6MGC5_9SPHI|nr:MULTISPECIES: NAD(P)H-binding protein [Mucilaginibacter]QEM02405.1 NAD(P)H-binding protein [Mucilaginibacter rubeus]QEM15029.1 NAD(P)H-binding protein [Mucilaginibacter gossypii]QTE42252.1 NAD(P)H-binding protein [Mucilaginibacter rubeus]QTE48854.1 NAD(P)H-binding protein [Mucilaginibacter rubeus]QTE53951.1 NAD(P)H-binding protein [Mucilaginibacter rubeus]